MEFERFPRLEKASVWGVKKSIHADMNREGGASPDIFSLFRN